MDDFLEDFSFPEDATDLEALAALKERVLLSPGSRLKWRVLKALGALPSQAKDMTDGDWLFCAVNLLLDGEKQLPEAGINPAFDSERYMKLKEAKL